MSVVVIVWLSNHFQYSFLPVIAMLVEAKVNFEYEDDTKLVIAMTEKTHPVKKINK